jgi:Fur family zinc uptake transcriptional regulator
MAHSSSHSHVHANTPCSPQDVDAFLEHAETIVAAQGARMTRIRRKVLRLLLESPEPAKAYDLLGKLDGEGAAQPPTIYRALRFLRQVGLVHKIERLDSFVACGHTSHSHSAVFLICNTCNGTEELHATETNKALNAELDAAGFEITTEGDEKNRSVIEVHGVCRACAA